MRNLRKNLSRYLGIGLVILLILAALYLPQVWFALRDAASLSRVQGESLAPLMVAQLDRSYERDIYQRMRTYMEAYDQGDVNCSLKEIAPDEESLWENIDQADNCLLMEILKRWDYVSDSEKAGGDSTIESCIQYVLMRRTDGQILLVANDILLDKGDGCHMELLIDGVDGTVYYLESEENNYLPGRFQWFEDFYVWDWWWVLNSTYHTEEEKRLNELSEGGIIEVEGVESSNLEVSEMVRDGDIVGWEISDTVSGELRSYFLPNFFDKGDMDRYCWGLTFGEVQSSWAMEIEAPKEDAFHYRIRLGLSEVINSIPDMAERISLAEYDWIYDMESGEERREDTMP